MNLPFAKKKSPRRIAPITRGPASKPRSLAAVAAAVSVIAFAVNLMTAKAASGPGHNVVVATATVTPGSRITAKDVRMAKVSGVPMALTVMQAVVGQYAVTTIPAGVPVVRSMVGRTATNRGLRRGEVGVWVPVNLTSSGMAVTGQRVDVLFSSNQLTGSGHQSSAGVLNASGVVLVQGARVLSVVNSNGGTLAPNAASASAVATGAPAAVELALPGKAASRVIEAETLGTLTLVDDPWTPHVQVPQPALSTTAPASLSTAPTSSKKP